MVCFMSWTNWFIAIYKSPTCMPLTRERTNIAFNYYPGVQKREGTALSWKGALSSNVPRTFRERGHTLCQHPVLPEEAPQLAVRCAKPSHRAEEQQMQFQQTNPEKQYRWLIFHHNPSFENSLKGGHWSQKRENWTISKMPFILRG